MQKADLPSTSAALIDSMQPLPQQRWETEVREDHSRLVSRVASHEPAGCHYTSYRHDQSCKIK